MVEVIGVALSLFAQLPFISVAKDFKLEETPDGWLRLASIFSEGRSRWLSVLKTLELFRTAIAALSQVYVANAILLLYQHLRGVLWLLGSSLARNLDNTPLSWKREAILPLNPSAEAKTMGLSYVFWMHLLLLGALESFERLYLEAWEMRSAALGQSVDIHVFLDNQTLRIPIVLNNPGAYPISDHQTMEMLRMWYCWMRTKKGFAEVVLPKKLVRIDRVQISGGGSTVARLGAPIERLNLGRFGSSYVVNFKEPSTIDESQRKITDLIIQNPTAEGLEFVTEWDGYAISMIALSPFIASLIFVAVWIGVFVGKYKVDSQVAVQTAFTAASYIVTAGALLIAVFAFLDAQGSKKN